MNQQKASSTTSSSSNTTPNAEIQTKKKIFGCLVAILSMVVGGTVYSSMDLTWDLICKNELIFKLYIALAALFFGALTLIFNKKIFLALAIALLTTSATLNKELFIPSENEQQDILLRATFVTEFLIATLLCIYIPHIKDLLIKK